MANHEILKEEIISPPEIPREPFVLRIDGEVTRLTLAQALQEIKEQEEKRKGELSQKARHIGETRPHGSVTPLSRRVQGDIRESLEKEIRKNPLASSYPLISCILRSHPDRPFQIPIEISPRSESFPMEGEENPFYRFICDRAVDEALRILNQENAVKTLWEIFFLRWELYQKVLRGEVSPSDAVNQFMEKARGITFPETLTPLVREIGEKFPLTLSRNHRRRF